MHAESEFLLEGVLLLTAVTMVRSKRVCSSGLCSMPYIIQRLRCIEDGIKQVLDRAGYTALSFKPSTIEELKQLDYGDVLLYFSCQKPDAAERRIKADIIEKHSERIKQIDQQTHTFGASLMELLESEEHSAWYFFWSLFDCGQLLDTNYVSYFSVLWLSNAPRFILSTLLMLHHAGSASDAAADMCWTRPLIRVLLVPFHITNAHQAITAGCQNLMKSEFNPHLLDHFYLRFNGAQTEHIRGSFGYVYRCGTAIDI